jgi:hypothetical protein
MTAAEHRFPRVWMLKTPEPGPLLSLRFAVPHLQSENTQALLSRKAPYIGETWDLSTWTTSMGIPIRMPSGSLDSIAINSLRHVSSLLIAGFVINFERAWLAVNSDQQSSMPTGALPATSMVV